MMPTSPRLGVGLALAAGLGWIVGVALIGTQADTHPVGSGYDAANRALTPALLLFLGFAVWLRSRPAATRPVRGTTVLVVAAALLLAGNLLEFWGVLLSDLPTSKTAVRLGEDESYWGSDVGWLVFLPGLVAVLVASVLLVRGRRWWGVPLAVVGSASTGLWAVSAALAAVAGLGMALWWLLLAADATHGPDQGTPDPAEVGRF